MLVRVLCKKVSLLIQLTRDLAKSQALRLLLSFFFKNESGFQMYENYNGTNCSLRAEGGILQDNKLAGRANGSL